MLPTASSPNTLHFQQSTHAISRAQNVPFFAFLRLLENNSLSHNPRPTLPKAYSPSNIRSQWPTHPMAYAPDWLNSQPYAPINLHFQRPKILTAYAPNLLCSYKILFVFLSLIIYKEDQIKCFHNMISMERLRDALQGRRVAIFYNI